MAEHGFISDKLEVKLLILYIASRLVEPAPFEVLQELSMCDGGVDYFNFSECLADLVRTEHLTLSGDRYAITDKGRRNSQICESSLPRSVRRHCDDNLLKVNEALRRESQVRSQILDNSDGTVTLCLTLEDGTSSPLLHLTLLASQPEHAQRWSQAFQEDPSALYLGIIRLLDQPKEDIS